MVQKIELYLYVEWEYQSEWVNIERINNRKTVQGCF